MHDSNRRGFLRGAGAAALTLAGVGAAEGAVASGKRAPFTLGMASYTFRKFSRDETVAMTKRLGLTGIAFKDFHLSLDAPVEAVRAAGEATRAAGLNLYGCGVVYMRNENQVNQAFDYARAAGMKMIIGVPDHALLPFVEKKIRETGIAVAIHNHGPGDKVYPSPQSAYDRIRTLDRRFGLCIDIGHTARLGENPAAVFLKLRDRVLDIHIKDVSAATAQGTTVEIGRGVIDIPEFLRAVVKTGYAGILALEYEKDEKDPLPGSAESIGYVRGLLAGMGIVV